jgi:hypothetical protein
MAHVYHTFVPYPQKKKNKATAVIKKRVTNLCGEEEV